MAPTKRICKRGHIRSADNTGKINRDCLICKKDEHYIRTYGITLADYNKLLVAQCSKCMICQKDQAEFKSRLSVDHDHITGKVRGLLCRACNAAIGYLQDSPVYCISAAQYLSRKI